MKQYTVEITDEALADMTALYEYIAISLNSPLNAARQYNRIADSILTLCEFPDRFVLLECEPEKSMGIHRMIVDNYLVCYVTDCDKVIVTNVFYGASDIHARIIENNKKERE